MDAKTRNALLARAGATLAEPTTRAAKDKLLERIGKGTVAHKPTAGHPYRDCFSNVDRYGSTRMHRHVETVPMEFNGRTYMRAMSCQEYIAMKEAEKTEHRRTA